MAPHGVDVAIVGDGPAGSALAQALVRIGVDVVLIGTDREWSATYTTWTDDLDGVGVLDDADVWLHRFSSIRAHFEEPVTIERSYGVLDNARLRAVLRRDVNHRIDTVARAADVDARIIVDATGWPSGLDPADRIGVETDPTSISWQSAYGVVLAEPPSGSLGEPTLMDFRAVPRADSRLPSFAYSLPVHDGWLVEETVLAGPSLDPDRLVGRLASRLDLAVDELHARALRVERVRIPMGAGIGPRERSGTGAVRFGAAAGMIHTATGYSVAASLRACERVAFAIGRRLQAPVDRATDHRAIADAVWPRPLRRSRRLHDYGLEVVLSMDAAQIRGFFQTFFELSEHEWAAYLRIDTPPGELAGVMTSMFRRADWGLRRRMVAGGPARLLGVLRP